MLIYATKKMIVNFQFSNWNSNANANFIEETNVVCMYVCMYFDLLAPFRFFSGYPVYSTSDS